MDLYDFRNRSRRHVLLRDGAARGLDLRSLIERFGPLPAPRAVHLLKQASHSLLDAHQHGFIHRDVKPANLFTCRRGPDYDFVKVLDFGLVKDTSGRSGVDSQLTQDGIASGTPAFMSPEAAVGRSVDDPRSDLYSLGCVAYWLVTGQLVFEGASGMAILLQHSKDAPIPPSSRTELSIPGSLEQLIPCGASRIRRIGPPPHSRSSDVSSKSSGSADAGPTKTRNIGGGAISPSSHADPRGRSSAPDLVGA
ncbi:MAG: serine/threonine-protein kinase [Candidatus Eisenbacteria bacterium]